MKKKRSTKLSLHKETLIHLAPVHFGHAVQGGTAESMYCNNPTALTCGCAGTQACGYTGGMFCTAGGCDMAQN